MSSTSQARPSVNKPLVLELVKGEYLDQRENILLVGPSGTGQVASGHGAGHGRLRPRPQGPLLPRDRTDHAAAGSQRRAAALAAAAATWQAGPA